MNSPKTEAYTGGEGGGWAVPCYPETPITIRNSSQSIPLLYQLYGPGGIVYGERGPIMALWMVRRTNYGPMDGPAGPTVRGTIYGMTFPGNINTS